MQPSIYVMVSNNSRIRLLVNNGAFGPALKTGNPVSGSVMILALLVFFLCGVKTIRPPLISAVSASPAQMPSFRRNGPGNTIRPLVETLILIGKTI